MLFRCLSNVFKDKVGLRPPKKTKRAYKARYVTKSYYMSSPSFGVRLGARKVSNDTAESLRQLY